MSNPTGAPFQQASEAPWWPPVVAFAVLPTLILLGIVLAAAGASDAIVVGVIVGPIVVGGLGLVLVALGALVFMPYALWRESRQRVVPSTTPQTRLTIRPEPQPSE